MPVKALTRPTEQKQGKTPMNNSADDLGRDWAVKIDYISLCSAALMHPCQDASMFSTFPADIAWHSLQGVSLQMFATAKGNTWSHGSGRKQYPRSVRSMTGAVLFYGSDTQAPLLECGGAACDAIRAACEMDSLIYNQWERISRLDLCGDLQDEITPADFIAFGRSPRHAAYAADDSATGSTRYVGSPTSDRRLKVYRYYEPHPRAKFIRVEVTVRRDLAKSAAAHLATETVPQVWAAAIQSFGLKAPQLRLPAQHNRLQRTLVSEPTSSSRLRWLVKQIKPAVLDAHRAGLINLTEWLSELAAD